MILQLNPALPMISPKGKCYAHFVIDYGIEDHLYWVTFDDLTGECWTWANPVMKIQENLTINRKVNHEKNPERS